MPEAMKHNDAAGAKAAAEYFWDTLDYLQVTGKAGPLVEVATEECGSCAAFVERYSSIYRDGAWLTKAGSDVKSTYVRNLDPETGYWLATQVIDFNETRRFTAPGVEYKDAYGAPSRDTPWMVGMFYDDESAHWLIVGIDHSDGE